MATIPASEFRTTPGMPLDGILLAEELLDLAERAQAYTNAAGVAIALLRGRNLLVRTSAGTAPEVGSVISADDDFIAECLRRRKPLCCRDTDADGRIGPSLRAMKTRSLIAIPICGQPEVRGAMVVIAPLPNAFQPTHTAILMTLSDIISSKLAAREACEVGFVDNPPPALAATPEPPQVMEMPVVAPISTAAAAPAAEPAAVLNELNLESGEAPVTETARPVEAAAMPASITAPAAAIPPALLKSAPLPLVEDKKVEIDPGLLHPAEDPGRFKPERMFGATAVSAARPEFVKSTPKPVTLTAIAPAPAVPARMTTAPAFTSWQAPHEEPNKRRILLPGLAVAAALVVSAVLWMHRATSADIAPPTIPVPAAAAASLPAETPVAAPPVTTPAPAPAKSEPVVASKPVVKPAVEEHAQPKPAKVEEAQAAPQPKSQPVIEIAAAQPKPKPEPESEMPAPNLAPAASDSAVPSLGKVHVALPAPPKSELVPAALISRVAPVYPAIARQLGIYGQVVLNVTIAPDGSISAVHVSDGPMQLRSAAVDAVRQWRYKPATLDGKAVESSAQVQVKFSR